MSFESSYYLLENLIVKEKQLRLVSKKIKSLYESGGIFPFYINNSELAVKFMKEYNMKIYVKYEIYKKLDYFESIHTLDLSGCKSLTDISPIRNLKTVHTLDLSGCERLTDISPISNLKIKNLIK